MRKLPGYVKMPLLLLVLLPGLQCAVGYATGSVEGLTHRVMILFLANALIVGVLLLY